MAFTAGLNLVTGVKTVTQDDNDPLIFDANDLLTGAGSDNVPNFDSNSVAIVYALDQVSVGPKGNVSPKVELEDGGRNITFTDIPRGYNHQDVRWAVQVAANSVTT